MTSVTHIQIVPESGTWRRGNESDSCSECTKVRDAETRQKSFIQAQTAPETEQITEVTSMTHFLNVPETELGTA
jgi:hypothetical protein